MKNIILTYMLILSFAVISVGQNGYKVGDDVKDFSLKSIDGSSYKVSDNNDNGVIIIFTSNRCPYSVLYEDRLIALENKYAAKGIHVVAINPNDPTIEPEDSLPNMKSRSKDKGFNFVYLQDDGQKVYPTFGATRTPEVFLLDKGMKLVYRGAIDDNPRDAAAVQVKHLEVAVDEMLSGKSSSVPTTSPTGCSIKTK